VVLYIETLFDGEDNPSPLVTGLLNSSNPRDLGTIDLFFPGPHSVRTAEDRTEKFLRDVIMDGTEFSVNDWKTHILALKLPSWRYDVYCRGPSQIADNDGTPQEVVKKRLVEAHKRGTHRWESVLAKAHAAYAHLERVGVSNGIEKLHPVYSTDTWSGRSKTTGFVIQNQNEKSVVMSVHDTHRWFLHFDWTAADARIASLLSGDPEMNAAFENGEDPYMIAVRKDRDQVKNEWLRVLYSMDVNAAVISYFPVMKQWMLGRVAHLKQHGWLESILGRRFTVSEHKEGGVTGERAVFNAVLQGSVAHAMQATLAAVTDKYPENILTEIHDSIVMTCQDSEIEHVIDGVKQIMTRPFAGILDSNPFFPVKISIGRQWKLWQEVKGL
jgi:hypothetical protein